MRKMKTKMSLCGGPVGDPACPAVNISDSEVTIGEDENTVRLKAEEWNKLVDLIKSGKLKKV